jgi:hypothetical protein
VVPNIFGSCVRNLLRGGSQILGKKFVLSPLNGRAYEDRFLLGDINPDDGNSKILLNAATTLPDYTASHSKRHQSLSGSNPGGGARFSAPVQTDSEAHPVSYTMGSGSFPRVKRPGRGVDHPPHLDPTLKKE